MNQPRGFDVEHYLATGEGDRRRPVGRDVQPGHPAADHAHGPRRVHGGRLRHGCRLRRRDAARADGPLPPPRLPAPLRDGRGDHARADRRRRLGGAVPGRPAADQARRARGARRDAARGAADDRRALHRRRGALRDQDPPRALLARPARPRRRGQGARGGAGRRATTGRGGAGAFQLMVAHRHGAARPRAWFAVVWWRRRRLPRTRAFLWLAVAAGPLAAVALEAGWVTTEVGRQPWIVYGVMRVRGRGDHRAEHPVRLLRAASASTSLLTVGTVFVLAAPRRQPRTRPGA